MIQTHPKKQVVKHLPVTGRDKEFIFQILHTLQNRMIDVLLFFVKLLKIISFHSFVLPLKMCLNILNHIEKLKSSRILLTASPCMLLWLQVTHYSQVLVHSTVVNSRNSLRYILTFAFIMQFCKL